MSHKIKIILLILCLVSISFAQEIGLVVVDTIDLAEVLDTEPGFDFRPEWYMRGPLGDFDMDGYEDFIMFGRSGTLGRYYGILFYGDSAFSLDRHWIILDPIMMSTGANVGDVNGDGYNDLLIGKPKADYPGSTMDEGQVELYYGGPDMDTELDWADTSGAGYACYGARLLPVGDDNGDDFADFIAVAPGFLGTESWMKLFYGSSDGPILGRKWWDTLYVVDWCLGMVSYTGDFNGDGLLDIIASTNGEYSSPEMHYNILINPGVLSEGEFERIGIGPGGSTSLGLEINPISNGIYHSHDFDLDGKDEFSLEGKFYDYIDDTLIITDMPMFACWMFHRPFDCLISGPCARILYRWYGGTAIDTVLIAGESPVGKCIGDINNDGYDELLVYLEFEYSKWLIITTKPDSDAICEKKHSTITPFLKTFPNPTNSFCTISLEIESEIDTDVSVFNLNGRKEAELFSGKVLRGNTSILWNTDDLSTGIYLVQLKTKNSVISEKVLIIK